MGKQGRATLVALGLLFILGGIPELAANDLSIQEHRSIAPRSIPVPETSDPNIFVAVTRLRFRNGSNIDTNTSISKVDFQVTKIGDVAYSDIASVKVLFEPQGGGGTYDNGRSGGDDLDIQTGTYYSTTTGIGWATLNTGNASNSFGWGSSTHIFIVLELKSTADYSSTIGCEITSVTYVDVGLGPGGTSSPGLHNTQKNLDKYRNTLTPEGIAPVSRDQGSTNVPVLKLQLAAVDSSVASNASGNSDMDLDKIRLHSLGTRDADISAAGVLLYEDDGDGNFEPGTDAGEDGEAIASGSLSGGYVTLNPPVDQFIGLLGKTYFVAVNLSLTAVVTDTVKLEVENPKNDFTFTDVIYDDNQGITADYACVYLGYPYTQKGYLTGTSATPTTGNSFTITELYISTSPTVISIVPGDGASGILRSATVSAEFSENMDSTTIIDADATDPGSNFIVFVDADSDSQYDTGIETIVAGSVGYAVKVATFTPSSALEWSTTYTARISTGVKDVKDGLNMTVPKVWVFSTQTAVPPTVLSRTPVNGASEVERSTVVTATFSEQLTSSTIIDADPTDPGSNFIVFIDADSDSQYDTGIETIVAGSVGYANPTATFTPASSLAWGATYTARIETGVTDTDGLPLAAASVWTFTTTYPVYPTVLSTNPAENKMDVPRSSTVSIVFSKPMDPASISSATVQVEDGGGPIGGSVAYNAGNRTATFTPTPQLDWGTAYTATVVSGGSGVKALDGLAMEADKIWTFETVEPVNPEVVNTSPAPGGGDVLPGAAITATFSRIMDPATIDGTSFLLSDSTGGAVSGVVTFDGTTTATFTPSASLLPGATYTATVTTAAEDADGLPLLAAEVWSFTTSYRPAVLSVNPASGAVGVSRGASLKIVFSKDVDPDTLTSTSVVLKHSSGAAVAGSLSYEGTTYTATFTPSAELAYATYTATVGSGAAGVKDDNGIEMASDVTWSFSTVPDLEEPVVANNRIVPGSSAPVTIFIPQPPAGASDRVTVQVFTPTGKRVVTLVNNQTYSEIAAGLPLLWDGTNGRAQKLGPGLYFIRISATGWTRTLKVLIVR